MTDKIKVNLFDSLAPENYLEFWGDQFNFSSEFEPTKVEWIRRGLGMGLEEFDGPTVFTDKDLLSPWVDKVKSNLKIAWLVECRTIHPFAYQHIWIHQVEDKFDYIFTFDDQLLERGDKYVKNLIGTSRVSDVDAGLHEKSKLLSLIASDKQWTRGHQLRHVVANAIKDRYEVDLWGSAYKPFGKTGLTAAAIKEGKNEPLKDYYFSIAIMNARHDNYFTETLVDLFRHGTIPVFWGCDNIDEYFNPDGMLKFKTGPELFDILDNLSPEEYQKRLPAVKENFEIAKNYCSMDDTFADNLENILNSLDNTEE